MRRAPRLPVAAVIRAPAPAGSMSGSERAMLIASAIMFVILFSAAIVLPHLPSTAAGW